MLRAWVALAAGKLVVEGRSQSSSVGMFRRPAHSPASARPGRRRRRSPRHRAAPSPLLYVAISLLCRGDHRLIVLARPPAGQHEAYDHQQQIGESDDVNERSEGACGRITETSDSTVGDGDSTAQTYR